MTNQYGFGSKAFKTFLKDRKQEQQMKTKSNKKNKASFIDQVVQIKNASKLKKSTTSASVSGSASSASTKKPVTSDSNHNSVVSVLSDTSESLGILPPQPLKETKSFLSKSGKQINLVKAEGTKRILSPSEQAVEDFKQHIRLYTSKDYDSDVNQDEFLDRKGFEQLLNDIGYSKPERAPELFDELQEEILDAKIRMGMTDNFENQKRSSLINRRKRSSIVNAISGGLLSGNGQIDDEEVITAKDMQLLYDVSFPYSHRHGISQDFIEAVDAAFEIKDDEEQRKKLEEASKMERKNSFNNSWSKRFSTTAGALGKSMSPDVDFSGLEKDDDEDDSGIDNCELGGPLSFLNNLVQKKKGEAPILDMSKQDFLNVVFNGAPVSAQKKREEVPGKCK